MAPTRKPSASARIKAEQVLEKALKGSSLKKAMVSSGFGEGSTTTTLIRTKTWQKLIEERLSDEKLTEAHAKLLNSYRIDHMVFPVAVKDEEITELLHSIGCEPKKIMHGEMAIHVWFWSPDNHARKDALDMAYKLKSKYAPEKHEVKSIGIIINPEKAAMAKKALRDFIHAQQKNA